MTEVLGGTAGTDINTDRVRSQSLKAVRANLVEVIIPNLTKTDAITSGHMALRLIDHILALDEHSDDIDELKRLESIMPQLAAAADGNCGPLIRSFTDQQARIMEARDPEAEGGVAQLYLGGRTSRADQAEPDQTGQPELTAATLTAYLRKRFPQQPEIMVSSLMPLAGGMSKQTIMVTTMNKGREDAFVIRKDLPISPSMMSVSDEYPMLEALQADGRLPVAKTLWHEPDTSIFGTPVIAVSLIKGTNDFSPALGNPALARQFASELARAMATLHNTAPKHTTAGPLITRPAKEHVIAEVTRWYDEMTRWKLGPEPVLESVFAWLLKNIPEPTAPSAMIHGDIGFHNMLMDEGQLVALLDWEYSHIGDPAEDVVYSRFFVEQMIGWPEFIDIYVGFGGIAPTAQQERFYAVWQSARNAAGCLKNESIFLTQDNADIKLGVTGLTFKPRFAIDALQRIIAP